MLCVVACRGSGGDPGSGTASAAACKPDPRCTPPPGVAWGGSGAGTVCAPDQLAVLHCADLNGDGCLEAEDEPCGKASGCALANGSARCGNILDAKGEQLPRIAIGFVRPGQAVAAGFVEDRVPIARDRLQVQLALRNYGHFIGPSTVAIEVRADGGSAVTSPAQPVVETAGDDGRLYVVRDLEVRGLVPGATSLTFKVTTSSRREDLTLEVTRPIELL